jgi:hypothetical protein
MSDARCGDPREYGGRVAATRGYACTAIAPSARPQMCKRGQSARADRPAYRVAPCVLRSFGQCG